MLRQLQAGYFLRHHKDSTGASKKNIDIMKKLRIIIGITGASGAVYARLLVGRLLASEEVGELAVIFSAAGRAVADHEGQAIPSPADDARIRYFEPGDLFAAPASGSARYDAMVVVPCSMGTMGRIASGVSDNLITRAADVMLKERRRLILVAREAPYGTIHLRNMTALSECGAIVIPASPSFYFHPANIEQLCMTVVERVLSLLGIGGERYEWGHFN
jgi:4-hydroxy-3-polyprenylbenzoate decarboxylase